MSQSILKNKPVPLPATTQDLLAMRTMMRERTLNDHVDDIHVALWSNANYHRAIEAVHDSDAVEGSLAADNFVAAGMIRDYAKAEEKHHVKDKNLATITRALNIVLRRYGISRKERALTVGGVVMQNGNDAD